MEINIQPPENDIRQPSQIQTDKLQRTPSQLSPRKPQPSLFLLEVGPRSASGIKVGDRSNSTKKGATREVFRPVTLEDLNVALSIISSDGKKITHADVNRFFDTFFPNAIPSKLAKILITTNPKENTITKEQLQSLLISRQCDHFEEAFQLMDSNDHADSLSDASILRLLKCLDKKYAMPRRGDLFSIIARFDRDKDGHIGKDDFKKMNMKHY
ncbi:hypothetical protein BCR33DRAFT_728717 [Rhizoclosmatium globosum]|uniref:EF-hand domain-containing protein n=1 Tax=Rhizoclosmatium globosum TaxID=329046 RepID=A0A1Y2AIX7_9FUNG|nr:hypothetical protein BCR33DRAFT_728717 [Rhizoclosmatium globosum]|eukprot:ORY22538.1 hypothetical protein BCR33DRAFT_728717 [Rhizoclosmatium globosum]